jgi:hypothetical protein
VARDAILKPILQEMWEMPYRDIAQELTNRNIPIPVGERNDSDALD